MMKTIGAGLAVGLVGLGISMASRKKLVQTIQKSHLYPELESGCAVALESNEVLSDIVQQLKPYFHFDFAVSEEFVQTSAHLSEFLSRLDEVKCKRSIPKMFRGFTSVMIQRLRELRRAIRDTSPALLEEFDEIAAEVTTYQDDQHHNIWCDSHPD